MVKGQQGKGASVRGGRVRTKEEVEAAVVGACRVMMARPVMRRVCQVGKTGGGRREGVPGRQDGGGRREGVPGW